MSLITLIQSTTTILLLVSAMVVPINNHASTVQGDDRVPSQGIGVTYLSRAARIAREQGVDSAFVALLLRTSQTEFSDRFVRINVTNYAQKADYTHNHNELGVRKVIAFAANNDSILRRVDSLYGVSPYVVASLLWVESKHGSVLGKYHVPSVYLSILLSCEPEFLLQNTGAVMSSSGLDSTKLDSVRMVVERKAAKKVVWAAEQLKALHAIQRKGTMNTLLLHGSWAGAFGMTQFIPSSYLSWAVDGDENGIIDLNDLDDAIYSVANYLKSNGWGSATQQQRAAVYHYNNSQSYVDAVLTLARKARAKQDAPLR